MAEPLPLCYLNGNYLPLAEARISPLDRGFLYADAVYELMPVYAGRPFRFAAHGERLTRSLAGISMEDPHTREEWRAILGGLIERNGGGDCYIYWQVTRGAQLGRSHAPLPHIPRTVFAFCAPLTLAAAELLDKGVSCVTAADTRWARCDIKSVALLANVLLRQLWGRPRRPSCCATGSSPRRPLRRCTWCSPARCSCRRTHGAFCRAPRAPWWRRWRRAPPSTAASCRSARRSYARRTRCGSRPRRVKCSR